MTVLEHQISHGTLEAVLRPVRPLAAVYLGSGPDVANEYQLSWETRWRPLGAALRDQGADEETVKALAAALETPGSARAARGSGQVAGFAQDGRVLAIVTLTGLAGADVARYGAPAHVVPLLAWAQQRPPYVAVVVDRAGGDLDTSIGGGSEPMHSTVEGPDDEIERTDAGGLMAQGRFQHRAEDSWAHNAGAVAEAVAAALHRVEGRILVVSGDVRASQLLLERLPEWVRKDVTVRKVSGSRANDGSQRARAEAVTHAVHEAVVEQTAALWRSFVEQSSPTGLAVQGAKETLAAIGQSRVGTLFVSQTPEGDEPEAWFGEASTEVHAAGDSGPVWADPRTGRLTDVAVRAAILTGAQVRVIPPDAGFAPEDGVGGICRFR